MQPNCCVSVLAHKSNAPFKQVRCVQWGGWWRTEGRGPGRLRGGGVFAGEVHRTQADVFHHIPLRRSNWPNEASIGKHSCNSSLKHSPCRPRTHHLRHPSTNFLQSPLQAGAMCFPWLTVPSLPSPSSTSASASQVSVLGPFPCLGSAPLLQAHTARRRRAKRCSTIHDVSRPFPWEGREEEVGQF